MALSSSISSLDIRQNDATPAWTATMNAQNMEIDVNMVYWNGEAWTELLDASLDQNIRGLRVKVTLTWDSSTQQSAFRTFVNSMVADFTGSDPDHKKGVRFYFGGSDYLVMIPDETSLSTIYRNQINTRFVPSLTFLSQESQSSIPSYLVVT